MVDVFKKERNMGSARINKNIFRYHDPIISGSNFSTDVTEILLHVPQRTDQIKST